MVEIENSALLADLFGHWPDFHDAELRAVRLQVGGGSAVLEADVEVAEMSSEVDARGYYRDRQRCRATLRFEAVLEVRIDGFRDQNVLDALEVTESTPEERQATQPWGERRCKVRFVPIPAFCAVEFFCDSVAVTHVEIIARAS